MERPHPEDQRRLVEWNTKMTIMIIIVITSLVSMKLNLEELEWAMSRRAMVWAVVEMTVFTINAFVENDNYV